MTKENNRLSYMSHKNWTDDRISLVLFYRMAYSLRAQQNIIRFLYMYSPTIFFLFLVFTENKYPSFCLVFFKKSVSVTNFNASTHIFM